MLGNMIKRITGKTTWWTPPATTLEAANTHITTATGAHAASAISLTPTGDVSANTVQAGIAEIATEKLAAAHSLVAGTVYKYRDLAAFDSSASLTGTIQILLPVSWLSTMMTLEAEGFNNNPPGKWSVFLSGYAHSSSSAWLYSSATLSPFCPFSTVRLAYDSVAAKPCILLGTTTTTWNNPKILLKEVLTGLGSVASYGSGWSINLLTAETNITGIVTPSTKTLATVESTAPRGYGLGEDTTRVSDANLAILCGFYSVAGAAAGGSNIPPGTGAYDSFLFVETINSTNIKQTLFNRSNASVYVRHYRDGVWQAWNQIPTMDLVAPSGYGLGTAATLASGDWNNYLTTGFFRGAYLANSPPPTAQYFVMVMRHDDNYVTQEAWSFAGTVGLKYFRTKASGVWSAWNQIITNDTIGHLGDVKFTLSSTPPPGWLKANGAAVSRTTYAALFAAMGTVFGVGDGSTTFNLPDLRGEFIRGWDDGRNIDVGRTLGSSQLDALQNITGNISAQVGGADMGGNGAFGANNSGNITKVGLNTGVSGSTTGIKFDASFVVRTATETRPRNVALLACIKY